MTGTKQFCTFFIDNVFFGIEVQKVQEVIRYREMTRVPLGPPEVSGLINLRGQIVTAIDMRRRLGLKERPRTKLPMNVVVTTEDGPVSLLVDEIGDVQELTAETFERPPDTLQGPARDLIQGAYKLRDKLLLVLDADAATQPMQENV